MPGTWVRSLIREDPTCHRATQPVHHNYGACALRDCKAQLLSPHAAAAEAWTPVLRNKKSHHSGSLCASTREKPAQQQWSSTVNKKKKGQSGFFINSEEVGSDAGYLLCAHITLFFFLMWTIFKVCWIFVTMLLLFLSFGFLAAGMWDFSLLPGIEPTSQVPNHSTTSTHIGRFNSLPSSPWRALYEGGDIPLSSSETIISLMVEARDKTFKVLEWTLQIDKHWHYGAQSHFSCHRGKREAQRGWGLRQPKIPLL